MRRLATALALMLTVAGCGAGPSDTAQIRGTLADLTRAAAKKDYVTLCRRILAPQLVQAVTQINLPCDVALARGLGGVTAPRLRVRSIQVHGRTALARVHTTASNQRASDDTVELVKIGGRWYVLSLLAPATPTK